MRRFNLWTGLLLLLCAAVAVPGLGAAFSGNGPPMAHKAMTEYSGPETCATCHARAVQEVIESVHYQQQGPVQLSGGLAREEVSGMYVSYSVSAASMASINWLGIIQPADESLAAQPAGCGRCHVGLGDKPSEPPDQDDEANVDCLICHSPDYGRTVAQDEEGVVGLVPADGVDVLEAAQNAQRPTPEMCGRCHLESGGGPNLAHGDYPTSEEVDVHMSHGFLCTACHTTRNHQIAGGGSLMAPEYTDGDVTCTRCHTDKPHARRAEDILDNHTDRIACQTCHIPLIARDTDFPTLVTRDYTTPTYDEAKGLYGPTDGVQNDVMPVYFWSKDHPLDVSTVKPLGPLSELGAQITPWKLMEVTVPYDAATDTPIFIDLSVYQVGGDLNAAILAGVEASGQEYSGEWKSVKVLSYLDAQHQVAPASEALWCSECHSTEGRLDWAALGYSETLVNWLMSIRVDHSGYTDCQLCHDRPVIHFYGQCSGCHTTSSWAFVHPAYSDCLSCHDRPAVHYDGQCTDCHNTSSWTDVDFDHSGYTDCQLCHQRPADHHDGQCSTCHNTSSWAFVHPGSTNCESCHRPPADHYDGQCSNCHHNTSNWRDVDFDHSGYTDCQSCHDRPADHYDGQCSTCHNTSSWAFVHPADTNCLSCHTRPADHYDGQCSNCHNTSSWTDVDFDHTGYTDCQSCHTRPADHYDGQCSNCHTTSSWAFVHPADTNCLSCHTPPADHYDGQCSTCHTTSSWAFVHPSDTNCQSCHTRPADHYDGQCSNCHNTSSWSDIDFDHTGYTNCQSCHVPPADHYDGQCSNCHTTSSWSNVNFDHTGYDNCIQCHADDRPEEHDPGQCSRCHSTDNWTPTGSTTEPVVQAD